MDKPSDAPMMMAPGHASGVAEMRLPGRGEQPGRRSPRRGRPEEWPSVDDYLDEPELTRWERVDGQRLWASPAKLEHGAPHFRLDYLLGAHTREAYIGAVDLKTRVGEAKEHASDTCLLKGGIDPRTGRRHLEELSFEVVNDRPQNEVDARARAFAARGVRRQIAIYVKTGVVAEWDNARQAWRPIDPSQRIHDKCLSRPLSVAALLDAALADDEVAWALEAKDNPAIVEMKTKSRKRGFNDGHAEGYVEGLAQGRAEGHAEGREEGKAQGLAEAILRVFASRSVTLDAENRQSILECKDVKRLKRLFDKVIEAKSAAEILAELEKA